MTYTCAITGKVIETKSDKARLPRGWRRLPDGRPCSPEGWHQRYELRVATYVISPDDSDWKAFRDRLASAWKESTGLANWAITTLLLADHRRMPDDEKFPPAPKVYLYGEAKAHYPHWGAWAGSYGAANCVLRRAEQKWRQQRRDVLWHGNVKAATFGYPQPYPLDADQWAVQAPADDDQRKQWRVSMALPGGRITVQVRQGKRAGRAHNRHRSDIELLEALASGDAVQCEAAILRRNVGGETHRSTGNGRTKTGVRVKTEECLKVVAFVPRVERAEKKPRERRVWIVTQPDSMLAILDEDRGRLWVANMDHVRRWIVAHGKRLQRLREDLKAEKRMPRSRANGILQEMDRACRKHDARMDSACKQLAAQVAGYCERTRVTHVQYTDDCKEYVQSFPWYELREKYIRGKIEALDIEWTHASGEVAQEA